MNLNDPKSRIGGWISTLDRYRMEMEIEPTSLQVLPRALDAPLDRVKNGLSSKTGVPDVVTITPESREDLSPPLVHLPVDEIIASILKTKPYMLGLGTTGFCDHALVERIVSDVALRCGQKTSRNTLVVRLRSGTPEHEIAISKGLVQDGAYAQVHWAGFGDSKEEKRRWNCQLADLLEWKQEFGLILFDLGDAGSPAMSRMGRLCNGIVIQMLATSDARSTIQILKNLQNQRIKIIGAWAIEHLPRSLAG
jgi:hypothetical protein